MTLLAVKRFNRIVYTKGIEPCVCGHWAPVGAEEAEAAAASVRASSATLDGEARKGVVDARREVDKTVVELLTSLYESMVDMHDARKEARAVDRRRTRTVLRRGDEGRWWSCSPASTGPRHQ